MKRTVLIFGLIAGAILSAMMLLTMPFMDQIGFDRGEIIGYTSMVLAFLLIFFGIRSYRDDVAGGSISFLRALAVGVLIATVASVCYVATWQVIYRTSGGEFMAKYQEHALEKARLAGATDAQLAARKAEMEKFAEMYRNPFVRMAFTFVEPMPVALVVSLVSAGVLRRRREVTDGSSPRATPLTV